MASAVPIGAIVKENGDVVIPATQRPDGTWRKEKKLKAGYIPQEEVARFETKGTQHQNHLKNRLPPGMAPEPAQSTKPPTAAQKKNAARAASRKAKKAADKAAADAAAVGDDGIDEAAGALAAMKVEGGGGGGGSGQSASAPPADIAKKVKALRKKIRQVEELEEKESAGGFVPTEDQRQKIARKPALLAELAELEG